MEKKKLILIGAGHRGMGYTDIAYDMGGFEVVAVAEPIDARRNYVAKKHNIPENMCFTTWEPLIALGKIADAAVICTMDREHHDPAIAAMKAGYDLLLEKPAAPTPEECAKLAKCAKKTGARVLVCHVLRYTQFFLALKTLIASGKVGDVMTIEHTEGVGNIHQTHSFIRGNWGNEGRSSFMLLQKSCHDLDILQWLVDKKCLRVQSFGSLKYFTEKYAPEGATKRCLDCPHVDTCNYSAKKIYLDGRPDYNWVKRAAPKCNIKDVKAPTYEELLDVVNTTNFGVCVFKCDNDVVDHQTVNMEFEDGITCTFNMNAFTHSGRRIRISGTKGELYAEMGNNIITYHNEAERINENIDINTTVLDESIASGHGGGDSGIIKSFYEMLCGRDISDLSNIQVSVENHMIAFAAEQSRHEGRVVSLSEYDKYL